MTGKWVSYAGKYNFGATCPVGKCSKTLMSHPDGNQQTLVWCSAVCCVEYYNIVSCHNTIRYCHKSGTTVFKTQININWCGINLASIIFAKVTLFVQVLYRCCTAQFTCWNKGLLLKPVLSIEPKSIPGSFSGTLYTRIDSFSTSRMLTYGMLNYSPMPMT